MNVLQVTPTRVHPPAKGGHNRAHGLVLSYPGYGDEVRRFAQGGILSNHDLPRMRTRVDVSDGITEIRPCNPLYDLPSIPPVVFGTPGVLAGPVLKWVPSQQFRSLLSWSDIVQVEMPYQVPAVASMINETPVVYSSHNVESVRWKSVNGTDSYRDRWSHRQIRRIEKAALRSASLVICTSERDRKLFHHEYEFETPTVVSPNAVFQSDICDCQSVHTAEVRASLGIPQDAFVGVFIGSGYEPNVHGVREIISLCEQYEASEFCILLVGSVCDAFDRKELPDNVVPAGFVDVLDTYLCAADIGLNPITTGGGTNIKVLDYFAKGLPVVSTAFGVRGFEFGHREPVLIGDVSEFSDHISTLRTDQELYEALATDAYEFAHTRTWEQVSKELRPDLARIKEKAESDTANNTHKTDSI